jgi:hypothetical protein
MSPPTPFAVRKTTTNKKKPLLMPAEEMAGMGTEATPAP